MYEPLSNALNYGLECLWEIKVDGLPARSDRIVFVPWDEDMPSDRTIKGSLFKPDVILMSFTTACDFRGITDKDGLTISQFVHKIPEKGPKNAPSKTRHSKNVPHKKNSPKTALPNRVGWKDVLSAVEVKKRGRKAGWPAIVNFTDEVPDIDDEERLDEELLRPPSPDLETSSDVSVSQSQTRKVHGLVHNQTAEELYSRNSKIWREQEADRE